MSQTRTNKTHRRRKTLRHDRATILLQLDENEVADLMLVSDAMGGANLKYSIRRLLSDVAEIVRSQSAAEPERDWEELSSTRPFRSKLVSQLQIWNRGKK